MYVFFILLLLILLLLILEQGLLYFARKKIPLVIQVNGTRGKSTVTRIIYELLRGTGRRVCGKTSGSAAMFLYPDGSEKPLKRIGPANVREQRNMLLKSACLKADVFVVECNAVKPELQLVSSRYLRPDITVITNVREDHAAEQGNAGQRAASFAGAVPRGSVLISLDSPFDPVWKKAARQNNLRLISVSAGAAAWGGDIDNVFPENTALVFALADYLRLDRRRVPASIAAYPADPGAFGCYAWENGRRRIGFIDARAANDPESTQKILGPCMKRLKEIMKNPRCILLVVNREDRPDRTRVFMRYALDMADSFDMFLFLGHRPRSLRKALQALPAVFIKGTAELEKILQEEPERDTILAAAGNYGGGGRLMTIWLEAKKKEAGFIRITDIKLS
ncbi:MAG: poly-gamma-glutamate synthase PgsB [Treponema sp.]|jgi:poly-gamma-glutamate synthase PgsB/CapB|nr:poly-gamma-glutamate synthase PgsB [Treponema sp.]